MDEITQQIVFGIAAPAAIGLVAAVPGAAAGLYAELYRDGAAG